ncbi:MAG: GNAT family N-acetyltransferase [Oscillospiraceae bacterium]
MTDTCPCKKKSCPRHGDCEACRKHHEDSKRKRPVYCEKHKSTAKCRNDKDMNRIFTAAKADAEEILALYRTFLHGAADWNENYPNEDTIEFDLSRNALFVMKDDNGRIIAAISIDDDKEVEELACWDRVLSPSAEFSRLCVSRDMQNRGIAKAMIQYVFDVLRKEGKRSVHILVKTGHTTALSLYSSIGFKVVGECNLYDKDFVCMEIEL